MSQSKGHDPRDSQMLQLGVGSILRGPKGGLVEIARFINGEIYVHKADGWNTISRFLKHPESYVRIYAEFTPHEKHFARCTREADHPGNHDVAGRHAIT